jgi:signal transduction histidine kinase/CheY-like chemotaxis protein
VEADRRELGTLERDLAEALERQAATEQVLQVLGRCAFELEPVFETVLEQAVRLCRADAGLIYVLDGDAYRVEVTLGGSAAYREYIASVPIEVGSGTLVGRVGAERRTVQIDDAPADPGYTMTRAIELGGFRTMLGVPMLDGERVLGVIVLWRERVSPFDARTVGLVSTFAAQGAIAIQNVQTARELEIASGHKSEFLASMSHELRTPLNAVIGFSDVLLDELFGPLNERQADYVRDIRDSGRHLLELINEILDLSRVEAGRMELEPAALSLPELLEGALALVRERAARQALTLSVEIAADVGVVWADETKLKQVVVNLLTNAVKFTPAGGAVDVRAWLEGDEVLVTVRDTGVGVPVEDRARIFEAFQRGDRRASVEGTGLGLTLSKRFLELHGGRIWLESAVGSGSLFGFAIPVGRSSATEEGADVLLIEDDRRAAELFQVYLEGAGYRVSVARDGTGGLELARALQPRVVVLDLLLPGIDGWDVLAQLKDDFPVVVVSMLDERVRGLQLGAAEYLVKPVSREDMLAALEVVL